MSACALRSTPLLLARPACLPPACCRCPHPCPPPACPCRRLPSARNYVGPLRPVLHATAHALLRTPSTGPDSAALLLAYAHKPSRIHSLTLRTYPHLLSHPDLRAATPLFVAARALLPRSWWICWCACDAAELLERTTNAKDGDSNSNPMTPSDYAYLRRRLALLRLERLRAPRDPFDDLCNRLRGVIPHMARAGFLGEEPQRRESSGKHVKVETSANTKDRPVDTANLKAPKLSPSRARQRMQDVLQEMGMEMDMRGLDTLAVLQVLSRGRRSRRGIIHICARMELSSCKDDDEMTLCYNLLARLFTTFVVLARCISWRGTIRYDAVLVLLFIFLYFLSILARRALFLLLPPSLSQYRIYVPRPCCRRSVTPARPGPAVRSTSASSSTSSTTASRTSSPLPNQTALETNPPVNSDPPRENTPAYLRAVRDALSSRTQPGALPRYLVSGRGTRMGSRVSARVDRSFETERSSVKAPSGSADSDYCWRPLLRRTLRSPSR
ncbi:hypothetical protein C8J57DRAFT_1492201 [Mycena rebaudengoi]|nr:hypothetical protein C8J57DRAFT_1492201 [Mycena rebaudengoi]